MWISMGKWRSLEKKVAELDREVQIQRNALVKHVSDHEQENMELRHILNDIKSELPYSGTEQTS